MAMIAVERNGVGEATVSHLRVHTDYPNVYRSQGEAGWITTQASRNRMLSGFEAELANRPELFASHRLLQECRTFVRVEGRCAAASGAHDDTVMAMAIALAVRSELRIRQPGVNKAPAREPEFAARNGVSDKIDRTRMCDG